MSQNSRYSEIEGGYVIYCERRGSAIDKNNLIHLAVSCYGRRKKKEGSSATDCVTDVTDVKDRRIEGRKKKEEAIFRKDFSNLKRPNRRARLL